MAAWRFIKLRRRSAADSLGDRRRREESRGAYRRTFEVRRLGTAMVARQHAPVRHRRPDVNRKLTFAWLDIATRQLSPTGMSAEGVLSPRLSPDGREIAFHVIDEGGVLNVWTQSARRAVHADRSRSMPKRCRIRRGRRTDNRSSSKSSAAIDTHIGIVSRDGGPVEPDRDRARPELAVFVGARQRSHCVRGRARRRVEYLHRVEENERRAPADGFHLRRRLRAISRAGPSPGRRSCSSAPNSAAASGPSSFGSEIEDALSAFLRGRS